MCLDKVSYMTMPKIKREVKYSPYQTSKGETPETFNE